MKWDSHFRSEQNASSSTQLDATTDIECTAPIESDNSITHNDGVVEEPKNSIESNNPTIPLQLETVKLEVDEDFYLDLDDDEPSEDSIAEQESNEQVDTDPSRVNAEEDPKRVLKCEICKQEYYSQAELAEHMRMHSGKKVRCLLLIKLRDVHALRCTVFFILKAI